MSTGTPDPSTPARYKSNLKVLGNGKGMGLDWAAERSFALSQCGLPTTGDDGDNGGDGETIVVFDDLAF